MMKDHCLKEINLLDRYATNRNDLIAEFYRPCLEHATSYDRAVGYFHSSIFLLAARPIAYFALTGGKIRLICSPELTKEDIEAFETGYEWRDRIGEILLRTINQVLGDIRTKSLVEFIATLIAVRCLDIRIAFRPGAWGIFHDKVGIIYDEDDHSISFTGSSNETFRAWDASGNHESFDVFRSWTTDAARVDQHKKYFESLWSGNEPGVETIHFPEIARDRLIAVANPEGIAAAYTKIVLSEAKRRKTLQVHQIAAIKTWKDRGSHGILQHATGSGKTITAIDAMHDWLKDGYPVLILVPSELLLAYWHREIQTELGDLEPKVLLAGGGHVGWRKHDVIEGFTVPEGGPRIIISTIQTASTQQFLRRIQSGNHLMLIIDEVHRAGSPALSSVLSINAGPRLGLSATPHRYGDPEGTKRILDYFDGIIEPPFTLADAIAAGRLCQYTYHIHPVTLDHTEIDKWHQFTQIIKHKLAISHTNETEEVALAENIKNLLIRRADILKNAAAKVPLAVQVLQENYSVGQRWLVYCDDQMQLQKVLAAIRLAGFSCDEYHSSMLGDRETTLDHFLVTGGIIVAIKCLDEGVDIPAVDHALILASSRNPREFIQRRGRVLRVAEGKFYAHIHDTFVFPPIDRSEPDDVSILRTELMRAAQFAESAANEAVKYQLRQIARDAGIELNIDVSMDDFEYEEGMEE